ncbi:MAG TPA: ABC transporter permease [Bryobacteraceae bacterium]|nr:ABC transporter permease [Bryobacteraceae bacterium]
MPAASRSLLAPLETTWQDASYAWRSFRKSPGFTAAVVVSIALGIAANTTVFSIVNAVLLGSLPVKEPARLVNFNEGESMSYPDYIDYRDQAKGVFEGVCASFPLVPASLGGVAEPERIWGQMASGNYFSVVGVDLAVGRGFLPEEDQVPGRNPVVVLSYGLWRRRFAGDRSIVGKTVILNNQSYTVVGVARAGFLGTFRAITPEFWVPLAMVDQIMPDLSKDHLNEKRGAQWLNVDARLKPGVNRQQALAAVQVVKKRLDDAYHKNERNRRPIRLSTAGALLGEGAKYVIGLFVILMTVVGLVLLIACANVANLLLARASARQKEIGIRLAIGADRGRLVRQLLTESILLSIGGAAVGFLLTLAAIRPISRFELPLPMPIGFTFTPDARVLAFTAALSVLTGVLFGLAPALRATRPDLVTTLKEQGALVGRSRRFGMRNLLVAGQVTLSLVLLVGSSLFLRSLQNASSIDLGLRPENVLLMGVDPKLHHYSAEKTRLFLGELRERVSALPGVASVSFLDSLPLSLGGTNNGYQPDNGKSDAKEFEASVYTVDRGYFETIGTPLVRGRDFRRQEGTERVAIINETLAERMFPGEDPLGRRFRGDNKTWEIIGVARNSKSRTLGEDPAGIVYLDLQQHPEEVMSFFGISILAKTTVNPRTLTRAVRAQVAALDPNLAVFGIETMQEHVNKALLIPKLSAVLLGVFGGVGLVLATVGLYGVLSYSVRRRTREIGIRMALGASASGVLRMVARQGMLLAGVGLVIGLAISLALWRLAGSFLYGISATDPVTFIGVPLLLLLVACVAALLPARRASQVEPMDALRYE